ncbi:16S rRNA (guanine(966)-N(2))-methyltransferase RsmD [Marispirochaeta aestuarii]|uniref:16S rRNA (Guanine(966)-N(2))-methyltransferase RsmD n=1 Tax=Marispirochaeta aestuarii TaxID=1963862 RepID=A0A1Y1S2V2_9SPIO|nr:16S rRNA (guanine(966)-N(2))-methyltransferase RsmD [Marispirochaeta aestuarii]ORC38308.1 16S rRNA (guanine(966)-N(2))-methyltransferase RsmD [Marispirochaeta aestuarii]
MRVTGGRYRGRTVKCPKGVIRPAMDRMRESLFNILGNISGESFLDLFSGSGVVGIEAASRGAEPVVLVEKDRGKRPVLLENISMVETPIRAHIMGAEHFLKTGDSLFDYIYLDPPFPLGGKKEFIQMAEGRLEDDGLLMIHFPEEDDPGETTGRLVRFDLRLFGRSRLGFYRFRD